MKKSNEPLQQEYVCEEMMQNYNYNVTRIKMLCIELQYIDNELIEQLSLPAVVLSSIPKSITNNFYSNTENVALEYENKKLEFIKEIQQLTKIVQKTDTMLNSLNEKERFIINKRIFETNNQNGVNSWRDIAVSYSEKFEFIDKANLRLVYKKNILPKLEKYI